MATEHSFGDRMKELREERGMLQDELAHLARKRGLTWTRSTVAKIEDRKRELRLGEWFFLTSVFRVTIADLVPTTSNADMGRGLPKADTRLLRRLIRGEVPGPLPGPDETPGRAEAAEAEEKAARKLRWSIDDVTNRALRLWNLSLTGERERRLKKRLRGRRVPGPKSLQAMRGRITRLLLVELEESVKEKRR